MLKAFKKLLDKALEHCLWIGMMAMTMTVVWQVFTRFVLRDPSGWTEELSIFLLIWIGLLGSAVALRRGAHLGIDVIVNRFSEKWRRLITIFIFVCVIWFSLSVLFIGGVDMVTVVLRNNQISPALGIRMGYIYLALPISGFFITMYAVEFIVHEVMVLTGRRVEEPPTSEAIETGVGKNFE